MAFPSTRVPLDSHLIRHGHRLALLLTFFTISVSLHSEVVFAAEDKCVFSKYKSTDSNMLNAAKNKLAPLVGKVYNSYDGQDYSFTVGICTELLDHQQDGAAVLQQETQNKNQHIIGSLKDTHIMAGTDWILLEYGEGENYSSHCGLERKHSSIMITCDETIDDDSAKMVFMEENNGKNEDCYYLFELRHKAVCPIPTSGTLSVGSILVIVFVCVAAVYFLVGFLYTRFVLKAKGMEQIPNYDFWKDFGNLQADGCDLVCRTKEYRRLNVEGGIGDAQLDSAEEIRDDNLLPM